MNAKLLLFPVAVSLTACAGIGIDDPSVKACEAPKVIHLIRQYPDGRTEPDSVTELFDQTHCRKAA